MPPPRPFQCGGAGQPACPPDPAISKTQNAIEVIQWFFALAPEHRTQFTAFALVFSPETRKAVPAPTGDEGPQ